MNLAIFVIAPTQLMAFTDNDISDFSGLIEKLGADDSFLNSSRTGRIESLDKGMDQTDLNLLMAEDEGFLGSRLETKWKKQEMGATLVKSQQKFNGLEVFGGEVVVRTDKNSVNHTGFLFKDIKVDKNPKISKDQAIAFIKEKFGDESVAVGKLGILPVESGSRLAYRFTVSKNIYESYAVYLDGTTGEFLRVYSQVHNFNPSRSLQVKEKLSFSPQLMDSLQAAKDPCDGTRKNNEKKFPGKSEAGSGIDLLGRRVPFSVTPSSDPDGFMEPREYTLWNNNKRTIVFDAEFTDIYRPTGKDGSKKKSVATIVSSQDKENWGDKSRAAISAHHHIEMILEFMNDKLKRDNLDDKGGLVRSIVNAIKIKKDGSKYKDNAFFNPSMNTMVYLSGSWDEKTKTGNFKNWAGSLDIAAHEMAHGITAHTSCLEYLNESGAINESFSDMMGMAVEYYYDRENFDWALGEDIISPANKSRKGGLRFIDHPNKRNMPDTYRGKYWYTGKADHGGVHTNSSVGNKAFYLMVEGGTHNGVAVPGIGMDKAVLIAYRANQNYLIKRSQYTDCAKSFILAAKDLYGDEDARKVLLAWKAVNLAVDEKIVGVPKKKKRKDDLVSEDGFLGDL